MKNLLVYMSPNKGFPELDEKETMIQIDSALLLGWNPQDILLITNFPYEYNGIKATVYEEGFTSYNPPTTKLNVLANLFKWDLIEDDIYWSHDMDAFQQHPFDLDLEGFDAGLCTYQRNDCIQLGSAFIKKGFKDIVLSIMDRLPEWAGKEGGPRYDEYVIHRFMKEDYNNIRGRVKILNGTYDFGMRRIKQCYEKADKPLKVVHFRPYSDLINTLDRAMYGRNEIGIPLMNPEIIKIFERHGIK